MIYSYLYFLIGTFYYSKQRPREALPVIHSKGVNYTNNGGGRDTYISDSAGGLRTLYQPASFKRTFYNNLRVYDSSPSPIKGPSRTKYNSSLNSCGAPSFGRSQSSLKSGGVSSPLTQDVFLKSQLHYGTKIAVQTRQVRDYQKNMDMRLSIPKRLTASPIKINKHVRNSGLDPVEIYK
jgi:hypothetical protein